MPTRLLSDRLQSLISRLPTMPLGHGEPDTEVRVLLAPEFRQELFAPLKLVDPRSVDLCAAGLWLAFGHLEECHKIAQSHESPDGNFWHAIMHRREGDFWNSKYWFRRVNQHPIAALLRLKAIRVQRETQCRQVETLVMKSKWDAPLYVDLCERALSEGGVIEEFCRRTQQAEWHLLFEHCLQKAVSG